MCRAVIKNDILSALDGIEEISNYVRAEVVQNKSSLFLKIILHKTQTLNIIKTDIIYESTSDTKL